MSTECDGMRRPAVQARPELDTRPDRHKLRRARTASSWYGFRCRARLICVGRFEVGDGCSRRAARARALGYRRIGCLARDERSVLVRRGPLGALHAAHSQERTGGGGGTRMLTSSVLIVCARRWSACNERAAHRFAPRELLATAGSNVRFSGRETLVEGPGQSNSYTAV
ncbi:hypothetical protein T492DRAFT_1067179 [Pavlovales sp. CCMP2436]|nr:hypothetical protein T492DRAFT_1067179 [Pavlovales sp. CCMP2436]